MEAIIVPQHNSLQCSHMNIFPRTYECTGIVTGVRDLLFDSEYFLTSTGFSGLL